MKVGLSISTGDPTERQPVTGGESRTGCRHDTPAAAVTTRRCWADSDTPMR